MTLLLLFWKILNLIWSVINKYYQTDIFLFIDSLMFLTALFRNVGSLLGLGSWGPIKCLKRPIERPKDILKRPENWKKKKGRKKAIQIK